MDLDKHFRKSYKTMHNRAYGMLKDYHLAEDAVQETYERALKYQHTFDGNNIGGWLNMILLRTVLTYLDFIRSKGTTQEIKPTDWVIEEDEFYKDGEYLIEKTIEESNLKPKAKEVLRLFILKGYKIDEVSFLTGASEDSIKSHTKRFKKLLKGKVDV